MKYLTIKDSDRFDDFAFIPRGYHEGIKTLRDELRNDYQLKLTPLETYYLLIDYCCENDLSTNFFPSTSMFANSLIGKGLMYRKELADREEKASKLKMSDLVEIRTSFLKILPSSSPEFSSSIFLQVYKDTCDYYNKSYMPVSLEVLVEVADIMRKRGEL